VISALAVVALLQVLVVANAEDPESVALADRYVAAHPDVTARLDLPMPRMEMIPRDVFASAIEAPLAAWWAAQVRGARPDVLVLMRGVPFRVDGDGSREGDAASVDSELTLLPRISRGEAIDRRGSQPNPYAHPRVGGPHPAFRSDDHGMVLVTRIDGFSLRDALALLARGLAAARIDSLPEGSVESLPEGSVDSLPEGQPTILIDQRGDGSNGDRQLGRAARALTASMAPVRVWLDTEPAFVVDASALLGYAAWGSNDARYQRSLHFDWLPGGLAATFVSSSARTLVEPPPDWHPGRERDPEAHYAGSPQSLVGDLIRSGATGASGYVAEPWLDGCVRPEVLFTAYLDGRTLAEAYYLAMPYLSWRAVVFGDPLARAPRISVLREGSAPR
jgi:uncharacterized protein (TIGR03790 family)